MFTTLFCLVAVATVSMHTAVYAATPRAAKSLPKKTVQKKVPVKKVVKKSTLENTSLPERQAYFPSPTTSLTPSQPTTQTVSVPVYRRAAEPLPAAALETQVAAATVNIVCLITRGATQHTSIGSGVVISPDGVIVTNAHVGIYSLFKEQVGVEGAPEPNCIARGGSPATYAFPLEAVYAPKAWVDQYASRLFTEQLKGTGAGDYMVLKRKVAASPRWVRGAASTDITRAQYMGVLPYLPIDTTPMGIAPGDTILGSGYPAEFLGNEIVRTELPYASSYITVGQALTFGTNTPDTFTLPGTILARAGISGGPATDAWGKVVGIMSTATREGTTAERTLRAISLDYINRDITSNHGVPLHAILTSSPDTSQLVARSTAYAREVLAALYP